MPYHFTAVADPKTYRDLPVADVNIAVEELFRAGVLSGVVSETGVVSVGQLNHLAGLVTSPVQIRESLRVAEKLDAPSEEARSLLAVFVTAEKLGGFSVDLI